MAEGLSGSPRFLVHHRLAAGGMGEVFLGTMVSHAGRRPVAIKRVAAERLRDSAAVSRLVAEARLGFQLTHANVCQVIDLVFDRDHAYFVMEYVRGLDLRALIGRLRDSGRRLDAASALYIGREVARALDFAHRLTGAAGEPLHLVHGDVTPPNILLSDEGEVKLADFGIARALGTAAPGTDVIAGTRGFVAPEVVGGNLDHRVDIYALGATLHAALAGEPPPAAGVVALGRTDVPAEVAAVVERAIAREARDRYLSAAELETALAFELARRSPGYTPAALAETVRGAARSEVAPRPDDGAPLFAIETQASTYALGGATEVIAPWQEPARPDPDARRLTATVSGARAIDRPRRRRAWLGAIVAVSLVAMAAAFALAFGTSGDEPAAVAVRPADAGASPPVEADSSPRPKPEVEMEVEAKAPGKVEARRRRARRPRPESRPAFLTVNATPWGAVEIDGRRVADETPAYRLEVEPGRRRIRIVYADGTRSRRRTVVLAPGEHKSVGFGR